MINVEREINARIDKAVEREYIRGQKRAEEERERCAKIAEAWWSANQECIEYSVPAYQFEQLGKYLAAAIRNQDQKLSESDQKSIFGKCSLCRERLPKVEVIATKQKLCEGCYAIWLSSSLEQPKEAPAPVQADPSIAQFVNHKWPHCGHGNVASMCAMCRYPGRFESGETSSLTERVEAIRPPPKEADDEAFLKHYIRPRIEKEEAAALRPPPKFTPRGMDLYFPEISSVPSNPEMEAHLL